MTNSPPGRLNFSSVQINPKWQSQKDFPKLVEVHAFGLKEKVQFHSHLVQEREFKGCDDANPTPHHIEWTIAFQMALGCVHLFLCISATAYLFCLSLLPKFKK